MNPLLEILSLLAISCLIGVFFTYRYWRSKYRALENELSEAKTSNRQLQSQVDELQKENQKLKEELESSKSKSNSKPTKSSSDKKLKEQIKELEASLQLQQQSLDEKEREIEDLSTKLAEKKISYYKQIDGKRYKAVTLMKADEAIAGKGDGRISKADAEIIFATISDGKSYTQVEKDTMRYLRDNYTWTEGADALFRSKVRSWAAKGHELDK